MTNRQKTTLTVEDIEFLRSESDQAHADSKQMRVPLWASFIIFYAVFSFMVMWDVTEGRYDPVRFTAAMVIGALMCWMVAALLVGDRLPAMIQRSKAKKAYRQAMKPERAAR